MVDELEFDQQVISSADRELLGCPLVSDQFDQCLAQGAISLIADDVKMEIYTAYEAVKKADAFVRAAATMSPGVLGHGDAYNRARLAVRSAAPAVQRALSALRQQLAS
jgi:hypothetical protein